MPPKQYFNHSSHSSCFDGFPPIASSEPNANVTGLLCRHQLLCSRFISELIHSEVEGNVHGIHKRGWGRFIIQSLPFKAPYNPCETSALASITDRLAGFPPSQGFWLSTIKGPQEQNTQGYELSQVIHLFVKKEKERKKKQNKSFINKVFSSHKRLPPLPHPLPPPQTPPPQLDKGYKLWAIMNLCSKLFLLNTETYNQAPIINSSVTSSRRLNSFNKKGISGKARLLRYNGD
ncbi:hypothetical protein Btru_024906 [Bulinus truncatus]|nr:hypothetical protein Btru_024906 [Bulinus truncatus]